MLPRNDCIKFISMIRRNPLESPSWRSARWPSLLAGHGDPSGSLSDHCGQLHEGPSAKSKNPHCRWRAEESLHSGSLNCRRCRCRVFPRGREKTAVGNGGAGAARDFRELNYSSSRASPWISFGFRKPWPVKRRMVAPSTRRSTVATAEDSLGKNDFH